MSLGLHATSSLCTGGPGRGARGQLIRRVHRSLLTLFCSMPPALARGTDIPEWAGGERPAAAIPGDADPLLSLGVLSCGLARPAGTDSLMWHEWLGERAGKPAVPPEHSLGAMVWLMTQPTALTGPGAGSHDGRGV